MQQDPARRFSPVKKIGLQKKMTQDLYHQLLTCSWRRFFMIYFLFFISFNTLFALLYWLIPEALAGTDKSFFHAFAFSVQTFSTVGYGVFSPANHFSHFISMTELVFSVFVTAVLTGLIFAKFSRPSARIIFSDHILVNQFDGSSTMMLRIGNLRANQIVEAQVRIVLLKYFKTSEGQTIRRQHDLKLVRDSSLFFSLTWTVMHVIDQNSPLFGMSLEDLKKENVEFAVSVVGYDASFSQTIHSGAMYAAEDVVFDKYFKDMFTVVNGKVESIDYNKFHELSN